MQEQNGQVVETWQSKLILKIARRKGFRAHELNDAHQQISLSLLNFQYDAKRAGGVSERAIVSLLIEKMLTQIQRTELRQRKNTEKVRRVCGASKYQPFTDDGHLNHQRRFELSVDLHTVMERLTPQERDVCGALSGGESEFHISKRLGVPRTALRRIIDRIRDLFVSMGMNSI